MQPVASAFYAGCLLLSSLGLIDNDTLFIGRLDVTSLAPAAIADRAVAVGLIQKSEKDKFLKEFQDIHKRFTDAGGGEIYLLAGLNESPWETLTIAVSVKGDGKKMTQLFQEAKGLGFKPAVEHIGQFIVAGSPSTVQKLKKRPAGKPRPELKPACEAAGDDPVQAVLFLPEDVRRTVEELAPNLPRQFGGAPLKPLVQGVRWAAAHVGSSGDNLQLVVRTDGAERAKTVRDSVALVLKMFAQETARQKPQDGDLFGGELFSAKDFVKFTESLKLSVRENQFILDAPKTTLFDLAAGALGRGQKKATESHHVNSLKQILLSFHNFHDVEKFFPANIIDKNGKPLLSWRVAILPYLEQHALYRKFHLDEPWDSEHNRKLINQMPPILRPVGRNCPPDKTTFLMPVGKDTLLAPNDQGLIFQGKKGFTSRDPKQKGIAIRDITDGTSYTIAVVDVSTEKAAIWTKPDDWVPDAGDPRKGVIDLVRGGFWVGFADGSVHFIPAKIDPKDLRALLTKSGGEVVSGY